MKARNRRVPRRLAGAVAVALLVGCGPADQDRPAPNSDSTSPVASPTSSGGEGGTTLEIDLDSRPFRLHLPRGYDPAEPVPLVVGLHGYTSDASGLDSYFGLTAQSDERGFLLAMPQGTENPGGDRFWNALPDGCCDFSGSGVDDSGYLSRLVEEVSAAYAVERVVLIGHSNGGYLAHRFACEHADQVSGIAALAGTLPADTVGCEPSRAVTVVHLHGDADDVVPYGGGHGGASAPDTVRAWAELNGCAPTPQDAPAPDVIRGAEVTVSRYADGCRDGRLVELWTIEGGGHVPELGPGFTPAVLDVLLGAP